MRIRPPRSLLPELLCLIFLTAGCAYAQSSSGNPKSALPDVSRAELEHLHPAVFKDLKTLISGLANDPNPSAKYVEEEFLRCKFTPLKVGNLGRAILVEGAPGHGATNATMLNIYLPEHGSYRRILEAAGFGPAATGEAAIPDLVFGWTFGVCHAKYYRYTFNKGRYETTGCDQESEGASPGSDDCSIQSCSGENLAKFPNPWSQQLNSTEGKSGQLLVGRTGTGAEILAEARENGPCRINPAIVPEVATADHHLVPPGNQVPFSTASDAIGRCGTLRSTSGRWETSDSTNTSINMLGIATCVHSTKQPAKITYSGTLSGQRYTPARLSCN
jgi:hypothetical protein